jgi:hypothetical protein
MSVPRQADNYKTEQVSRTSINCKSPVMNRGTRGNVVLPYRYELPKLNNEARHVIRAFPKQIYLFISHVFLFCHLFAYIRGRNFNLLQGIP